jgi:hypothetical protein
MLRNYMPANDGAFFLDADDFIERTADTWPDAHRHLRRAVFFNVFYDSLPGEQTVDAANDEKWR